MEERTRKGVGADSLRDFAGRLFIALEFESPNNVLADGLDVSLVVELQELPERSLVLEAPNVLLGVPLDQLLPLGAPDQRFGLLEVVFFALESLVVFQTQVGGGSDGKTCFWKSTDRRRRCRCRLGRW